MPSLELEYERARLTAELAWVRDLITDVDKGELTWSDDLTALTPGDPAVT